MAAYAAAVLTTPAGISGAVLLLPFQVSVLDTPSLAATPTNLLYADVPSVMSGPVPSLRIMVWRVECAMYPRAQLGRGRVYGQLALQLAL